MHALWPKNQHMPDTTKQLKLQYYVNEYLDTVILTN